MTDLHTHPHAAMDRFPAFLSTIRDEFPDDCDSIADDIIDAELGDFCWESRIAERRLGLTESFGEGADDAREEVSILGFFRGQYLVATCILDAERRLQWMPKVRHYDVLTDAETAFLAPQ